MLSGNEAAERHGDARLQYVLRSIVINTVVGLVIIYIYIHTHTHTSIRIYRPMIENICMYIYIYIYIFVYVAACVCIEG